MSVKVDIVRATREHAHFLAPMMRYADVLEVQASAGFTPLEAITHALEFSEFSFAVFFDGQLAAVFGVGLPVDAKDTILCPPATGIPWLLTSEVVDRHHREFCRVSKQAVAMLSERYETLVQWVDLRHTRALRWAAWVGFSVGQPVPFGVEARLFRPIIFRRSNRV